MDTPKAGRADLAALAAVIERLAIGLSLAEEPGGFTIALAQAAPAAEGEDAASVPDGRP